MQEIIVRKYHLDGIPISTYETNDSSPKPIIFSFHGFDGYKDGDYFKREDDLARLGFIVIGIDSILHGERRIPLFESLSYEVKMKDINHVIISTAQDAVKLYQKYFKYMPRVIVDEVYAIDVSMGGAISIYMSTIFPLKKAVSIVGSPSMGMFYKVKQALYQWPEDFYYQRNLAYIQPFDPVDNSEKIRCPLFLTGGLRDDVIPCDIIKLLHHDKVLIKLYDSSHMPTQIQFNDAYDFLTKKEDV